MLCLQPCVADAQRAVRTRIQTRTEVPILGKPLRPILTLIPTLTPMQKMWSMFQREVCLLGFWMNWGWRNPRHWNYLERWTCLTLWHYELFWVWKTLIFRGWISPYFQRTLSINVPILRVSFFPIHWLQSTRTHSSKVACPRLQYRTA